MTFNSHSFKLPMLVSSLLIARIALLVSAQETLTLLEFGNANLVEATEILGFEGVSAATNIVPIGTAADGSETTYAYEKVVIAAGVPTSGANGETLTAMSTATAVMDVLGTLIVSESGFKLSYEGPNVLEAADTITITSIQGGSAITTTATRTFTDSAATTTITSIQGGSTITTTETRTFNGSAATAGGSEECSFSSPGSGNCVEVVYENFNGAALLPSTTLTYENLAPHTVLLPIGSDGARPASASTSASSGNGESASPNPVVGTTPSPNSPNNGNSSPTGSSTNTASTSTASNNSAPRLGAGDYGLTVAILALTSVFTGIF